MNKTTTVLATAMVTAALLLPGSAAAQERTGSRVAVTPTGRDGKVRDDERSSTAKIASFDQLKARCLRAISDRQAKLDGLSAKVARRVDPHDADLVAIVTTAKSGLIAVQAAIETNTADDDALKADCRRIVTDLRIYALRVPQISLVMTIDKLDAAMDEFAPLYDQMADAVAAAEAAGDPDAADAQELLGVLEMKLADAQAKIDGIDVASLLTVTPAVYNAGKKVLSSALQAVRSARADIKKASQLARHIVHLLESGDGET